MNNIKGRANIGISIFLFFIAIILIFFSLKRQSEIEERNRDLPQQISQQVSEQVSQEVAKKVEEIISKPSDFPDFDSLKRLKSLKVIEGFESWTPNAKVESQKTKEVIIVERGQLLKGYLYMKISLDGKALTKWESVYVKINNYGGHLFRKESLPLPSSEKTEILYALDDIPYLSSLPYSEQRVPFRADWFQFFRENSEIEFLAFVSSLRPAVIEEATLYYGCLNKSDCLLSIKKTKS